jgi:hypothetical protein
MTDDTGEHRSGATARRGELPEDASLEDVVAALTAPPAADSAEAVVRRRTEHLLLSAVGAAVLGEQAAVWRRVRAVVEEDPVLSAPVVIAADRLCAQLLDGIPLAALAPDACLRPALDLTALTAAPDVGGAGGADVTRLLGVALPVVTDLLTATALRPAAARPITERLRRDPDLAGDVLYLMVAACAQRLAVALRRGEQALRAHAVTTADGDVGRAGAPVDEHRPTG